MEESVARAGGRAKYHGRLGEARGKSTQLPVYETENNISTDLIEIGLSRRPQILKSFDFHRSSTLV